MARHSRGHIRYHRDRILSKRIGELRRVDPYPLREGSDWFVSGKLVKSHYYDCGHTRCGCCHWEKYQPNRRAREQRDWRKIEATAW